MQNFFILRELQTEFLKFKIHFAKISYKEFLIKKTECIPKKSPAMNRYMNNPIVTNII